MHVKIMHLRKLMSISSICQSIDTDNVQSLVLYSAYKKSDKSDLKIYKRNTAFAKVRLGSQSPISDRVSFDILT